MKNAIRLLCCATVALLAVGLVVLASASSAKALKVTHGANPYFFVQRQGVWLGIASLMALFAAFFDYHRWRKTRWLAAGLFAAVAFLLLVTVLPRIITPLAGPLRPFTRNINGSFRWIDFGPIRLQPGELAKLSIVICLSVWLDKIGNRVLSFAKGVLIPAVILGLTAALLLAEPDFGSTFVACVLSGALMLYSGVKLRYLIGLGTCMVVPICGMIALNDNRRQRFAAWLAGNESGDAAAKSTSVYQLQEAKRAICNGGLTGRGFGESMQQYGYLPEAHTDFIFAIGAEEWGLAFSLLTMFLFLLWIGAGVYIATHAADRLGRLLAYGMTYLVGFQAFFNMAVVCGAMPTKGLALPFMSYGGTNLMTALIATAVVFNVGRYAVKNGPLSRGSVSLSSI